MAAQQRLQIEPGGAKDHKVDRAGGHDGGGHGGGTHGLVVGHIAPEAWVGGPIGLVKNGDSITIDADKKELTLHVDAAELDRRKAKWTKPELKVSGGVLAKYAKLVSSAAEGAVTG
jgi:dihydroxy-acid dehydratase